MRIAPGGTKAFDPSLREERPEEQRQRRETYLGMAHFAGTGPAGQICRNCAEFRPTSGAEPVTRSGRCSRTRQLTGRLGESFPGQAEACKYFTTEAQRVQSKVQRQAGFGFERRR